jgi:hypothetical protein
MRIGEVKDTLLDQSVQVLSYSGQLVSLNIHTYVGTVPVTTALNKK